MNEISFDDAKNIRLNILSEIHNFCKANNIQYSLAFGTLLGAIRHKGFIPWDDDLDIMMTRPNLERFVKEYKGNNQYEVFTNTDNKCLVYGFARVQDKTTCSYNGRRKMPGVNVEIYPIDGVPSSDTEALDFYKGIEDFKSKEKKVILIYHLMVKYGLWPFHKTPFFIKGFINDYHDYGTRYDYKTSNHVALLFGNPYKFKKFEKSIFERVVEVPFENKLFNVLIDYEVVLKAFYNDYMQLPPIEKRVPAHGVRYYRV